MLQSARRERSVAYSCLASLSTSDNLRALLARSEQKFQLSQQRSLRDTDTPNFGLLSISSNAFH